MGLPSIFAVIGCLSLMLASGFAQAACSQEEAGEKGIQLAQLVQQTMARDPAAGQAMMMKMRPIIQSFQAKMLAGTAVNWDIVCVEYDALIEQAQ